MMEALVRLDEVEEAEEVLKEWETSGRVYDFRVPSVVIVGYIEKGLCEKAKALLPHLEETGKALTPDTWGRLARGYLEKGMIENTLKSLKTAVSLHDRSKGHKLSDILIAEVVRLVGEKGSSHDAESVVSLLRSAVRLEKQMYDTLLKSCITSGKQVDRLMEVMRSDDYQEDEETLKILSLQQIVV